MTSWLVVALDLVDALDLEGGALADGAASCARDPTAEFGLRLAREDLDLLPDLELVLELPDAGHLRTGVARDHGARPPAIGVGARRPHETRARGHYRRGE